MKRTVTVTGVGSVPVAPDSASLRLTSNCRAATVGEAVAGLAAAVDAVQRLARAATAPRHVRTTGLQVWPRHDEHGRPDGAEANQQVHVRCPDLPSASQLLTALVEVAGETLRVDGFDLEVSDPSEAVLEARERAFVDARARAEHLAALSGAELAEVVTVVEGSGSRGEFPVRERMLMAVAVPIEPGQSTVDATVQVTWRIG